MNDKGKLHHNRSQRDGCESVVRILCVFGLGQTEESQERRRAGGPSGAGQVKVHVSVEDDRELL